MTSQNAETAAVEHCPCGCGLVIDKTAQAYWNGIPVESARGTAVVADSPAFPEFWAKREGIIGQRIPVVMVNLDGANYGGGITYLDNRNEQGWQKVAYGKGSPRYGHKDLDIEPGSFEPEQSTPPGASS